LHPLEGGGDKVSDVSVLSHEYKRALDFAQGINGALIRLKTKSFDLPGAAEIPEEDVVATRRYLAETLAGVVALLTGGSGNAPMPEELKSRVPGALIERLKTSHRGDVSYFAEELLDLTRRLTDSQAEITQNDFALLDQVSAAADATTSTVFRRLVRT
jgi:hypothetical protein